MLRWASIFLIIAITAAIFGFTGIAQEAAEMARTIFYIFLVLVIVTWALGVTIFKKKE